MAKSWRMKSCGAIHQMIFRDCLRRDVCEGERDCQRLLQGVEQTVGRFGWDLLRVVLLPN
jgi:hypothetical protein